MGQSGRQTIRCWRIGQSPGLAQGLAEGQKLLTKQSVEVLIAKYKAPFEQGEMKGGAGKAITVTEKRAAKDDSVLLGENDPYPQTVYRVAAKPGDAGSRSTESARQVSKTITASEWLEYGETRVPKLYDEIMKGEVASELKDLAHKRIVEIRRQRPSLFDFSRKRAEVLLVKP